MARFVARIPSPWPADRTFAFMSDMRQFARWDPNVRRVEQTRGEGSGADAVFDVTVSSVGGELTMPYETKVYEPPSRVVLRGVTPRLESLDEIRVEADGAGSVIVYDAQLWLRGFLSPFSPLMGIVLGRIGKAAVQGLRELLEAEGAA